MKLESIAQVLDFDAYKTRTEAESTHNLGELVALADMRMFRYAKVGAGAISAGKLQLAPAPITNHHNCTVAAAAAKGAMEFTATLGATAAGANIYGEGYACVNDEAGEGATYKIKYHAAVDSSGVITAKLFDPIAVALTTASQVSFVHNKYNGVVEGTSSTQAPAGVPLVDIAIGDYGWLQTKGVAAVLADETITIGAGVTAGTSTAGAVEEIDQPGDTTVLSDYAVGWAIVAGVDTEYRPINLAIE